MEKIEIKPIVLYRPFDAHMHWRDKATLLHAVARYSIDQFSGGLLMPNTNPKIISLKDLEQYRHDVIETCSLSGREFFPIFTFYLSSELRDSELLSAWANEWINGVKYYPKGGTTNSNKGLEGFKEVSHILELMQKNQIPLLIHGETPILDGKVVDDFKREQVFMEAEMVALVRAFPELLIVLEHITTKSASDFVMNYDNVRATITPQHCLVDSRALFNGVSLVGRKYEYDLGKNGSYPSLVCRPILKPHHELRAIQLALILQAKLGLKKFGLGTDTAPHTVAKKLCECGACGVFSAPIALQLYAMAFEQMGILDHLPVFACDVMPEFYGIKDKLPKKIITLVPEVQKIEADYNGISTPFSNLDIPWSIAA